jgi:hypothetical protein
MNLSVMIIIHWKNQTRLKLRPRRSEAGSGVCVVPVAQDATMRAMATRVSGVFISANVLRVFLGVLFVFCDAGLAAEFHFLITIDLGDWITYGAELVIGDSAGIAGVALDARSACGGAGSEEECGGE